VAERERIKSERAAAEARYKQAEAECKQRFVVSSCMADAQAQRREAMTDLRLREITLDEAKRKAEADASAKRIEAKRAEAASRLPPVPRAASAPPAAASSPPSRELIERVRPRSSTADDPTEAAARAAAQQRRASEAAAHRKDVEERNAERAARGKKSTPLPVPSAASVAAAGSAAGK
jgi:hypothetical protein